MAYLEKKMYTEGLREVETWALPVGWFKAWAYAAAGRRTDALRILDQLLQQPPRNWASRTQRDVSPAAIARVYNLLGDTDRAFQWLDKAYEDHDLDVTIAVDHPEFANLRTDPRYVDLARKLRLLP